MHESGGNFTRWPVNSVGSAIARELGHNTVAHDTPKVRVFRECRCDLPWPIKSAAPRSRRAGCRSPFRRFIGGRKACRSFGVAFERFVEYFLLLSFGRNVKNFTVLTSLKKSSKEKGRIGVEILTFNSLEIKFLNWARTGLDTVPSKGPC